MEANIQSGAILLKSAEDPDSNPPLIYLVVNETAVKELNPTFILLRRRVLKNHQTCQEVNPSD